MSFIPSLSHQLLKHSSSFIWYFALGWGFLTTFGERTLPHPWAIDQIFYFLVKSPPLARTTPPPHGVYIDRCIIRINFLLKFVLPKRSSQNVCKRLFLEKRKQLLLSCYCVTSSEGFKGIPELDATSRITYSVYRSTGIYFLHSSTGRNFLMAFFLFSVTRALLNLVLIASYRRRV